MLFEMLLHTSQVAHQAGTYSGFSSMKRLGVHVFLLPHGWDASPSQGYPLHSIRCYPFIHLGGERLGEWLVQEVRTMFRARTRTRSARSGVERTNHGATMLHDYMLSSVIFCKIGYVLTFVFCLSVVYQGTPCFHGILEERRKDT